jgi:hypothetical protein
MPKKEMHDRPRFAGTGLRQSGGSPLFDLGKKHLWCGMVALTLVAIAVFLAAPTGSVLFVAAWLAPLFSAAGVLVARIITGPASVRSLIAILLAGVLTYLVASFPWLVGPVLFGNQLPFPSPVDLVYFASYAIYAVFLALLLRRTLGVRAVENRIALVDALILTTSMSAPLWGAVIEPQVGATTSLLAMSAALVYPCLNLLLFGLAARLCITAGSIRSAAGVLLLAWIGAEVAGDVFYGFQSANGTFDFESPLMVTWMLAYALSARWPLTPNWSGC